MNISSKWVMVSVLAVMLNNMVGYPGIWAQTTVHAPSSFLSEISKPQTTSGYTVSDNMDNAGNANSTVAQPQQCTSPFQILTQRTTQQTQPQQSTQPVHLSQQMQQIRQASAPQPPQNSQIINSASVTSAAGIPYMAIDNRTNTINGPNNQASLKPAIHSTPQISYPSQINQVSASISTIPRVGNTQIGNIPNQILAVQEPAVVHHETNTQPIFVASNSFPLRDASLHIPAESSTLQAAFPGLVTPTEGYTIEQLQQMALQSNPVLNKKRRNIEATYGTWLQVGLYENPTIGFIGEDYTNGGQGKQGLAIEQEIVRGNKLGISRNVEKWSIEIARKEWEIAQVKVVNDVKALAYDYMVATYLVEANRTLVKIAKDCVGFSESMAQASELGKNELLQNRILYNRAMVELSKAEQDEQEKWTQLVAMVGRPDLAKQGIVDMIGRTQFDTTPEQIWQNMSLTSPEVQLEQLRRKKAQCAIAMEKAEAVSNITVGGALSYHVTEDAMVGDVSVSMPLRVYDRNQGNIRKAQAEAMAQACEIERIQLELRTRFATEWNNYTKARTVMRHYETSILPDAKESINLALQGAKHGELTSLELLITQQTYIQSLIEYIDAMRGAAISSTYINGMLLKGGLDAQ